MNSTPFVKVCGQTHLSSIDDSIALGARFCGFVFHPRSPRSISPGRAALLETGALKRVGVFVEQNAQEINDIMKSAKLDYAQLHGEQDHSCAREIGTDRVIRVIWPERYESLDTLQAEIDAWADDCVLYLLDAGQKGGGSGKRWRVTRADQLHFPHPWILAGGLSPENLAETLDSCKPDGIDLNSGVEMAPGLKCADKLRAAFNSLNQKSH